MKKLSVILVLTFVGLTALCVRNLRAQSDAATVAYHAFSDKKLSEPIGRIEMKNPVELGKIIDAIEGNLNRIIEVNGGSREPEIIGEAFFNFDGEDLFERLKKAGWKFPGKEYEDKANENAFILVNDHKDYHKHWLLLQAGDYDYEFILDWLGDRVEVIKVICTIADFQ